MTQRRHGAWGVHDPFWGRGHGKRRNRQPNGSLRLREQLSMSLVVLRSLNGIHERTSSRFRPPSDQGEKDEWNGIVTYHQPF
jgi:hypothetical protein